MDSTGDQVNCDSGYNAGGILPSAPPLVNTTGKPIIPVPPGVPVNILAERSPRDRALYFEDRRAELLAAGQSTTLLDAAADWMKKVDIEVRGRITRWAWLSVQSFYTEHAEELSKLSPEELRQALVEATVTTLYAYGAMNRGALPEGQPHPTDWHGVPAHLWLEQAGAGRI